MADIREFTAGSFTANVTLTTTTEGVVITSDPVSLPAPGCQVYVFAIAQLTSGTNTTAVTPRIRRGTAITDTLVGEANAETIKTAAGSTESFALAVVDAPGDRDKVTYSFTLQQTAASANGTTLQGSIMVIVF